MARRATPPRRSASSSAASGRAPTAQQGAGASTTPPRGGARPGRRRVAAVAAGEESTQGAGEGAGDAGASCTPLRRGPPERGKGVEVGREHPIDKPAERDALDAGNGARTGDGGRREGEVDRAAESTAGPLEGGDIGNGLDHAHTVAYAVDYGAHCARPWAAGPMGCASGGVCARVGNGRSCTGNDRPVYEKRCTLANSG